MEGGANLAAAACLHQSCQRQTRLWRGDAAMKAAFAFPELQERTDARPAPCPRCGHVGMGRPRIQRRPVVDLKATQVEVVQ